MARSKFKTRAKIALGILKGKAMSDLIPSGSWQAMVGNITWKEADSVFENMTSAELEKVATNYSVAWSCIQKIGTATTEAPLIVGKQTDEGFIEETDHHLQRILKTPNPRMAYDTWLQTVVSNLKATGEAYIWEWRNKGGIIEELWPIPKSWVSWVERLNEDGTATVAGYHVNMGRGLQKFVPIQDMTLIYQPDISNPMHGVGPLHVAQRDIQIDVERMNYMAEMVTNMKMPGLTLYQPDGWKEDEKNEARALIADLVGKPNRGKPLFLHGEGAKAEMMAPLKDLDWPGLSSLSETRICSCFGVPPITVGLRAGLESATYSNYEQADRSFYRQTMTSFWKTLQTGLTRGLLTNEDEPDVELQFNLSKIWQLQEDATEAAERASKLFLSSLVDRNEGRRIAGEVPLEGTDGNVWARPINLVLSTTADPEEGREDLEDGKGLPAPGAPVDHDFEVIPGAG